MMKEHSEQFPACVELNQYRLIEASGTEAEKYLQGQLTCDVVKLAIGEQTLTCHCDPKGKMSALFRLYRHTQEQFFMIMPVDLLPEALIQLKKYAVFSKVTFTEYSTPLFGIVADASGEFCEKICNQLTTDKHVIFSFGDNPKRAIFWGDEQPEKQTNADSQLWDRLDIQQGIPLLYKANQFELIPQATNLQRLDKAISFTKGCYIGQEMVARAKYRGANKRAMFAFEGKISQCKAKVELPNIGTSIEMQIGENWRSTGTILACIYDGNSLWLQVVLNKDVELNTQFRVSEWHLTPVSLPYHLDETL
ncbi:hypothetical protein EV693_11715 [Nicoletella semolina]|uniref:tRNA-modifying protein YgfZ-like beta-barrel domain-containing protein n=2 Tax=Nicoletella semolina TaxID=271160 RepID=A0A4R2N4J2_9PAST|nr:hypothetical protein [Nicoletella semolina]TCP15780.1 hypothetical protein EV693_11715 [Nicoletella semolina]